MNWTIAASAFDTVHTLPSLEFVKSRLEEMCYSTRSFAKGGNDTQKEFRKRAATAVGVGPARWVQSSDVVDGNGQPSTPFVFKRKLA